MRVAAAALRGERGEEEGSVINSAGRQLAEPHLAEPQAAAPQPPLPPPPRSPALSSLFSSMTDAFSSSQALPNPPRPLPEATTAKRTSRDSNSPIEISTESESSSTSAPLMVSMGQPIDTGGPTLDCRLLTRTLKSAPHCEPLPPSSPQAGADGVSGARVATGTSATGETSGGDLGGATKRRQLSPSNRKNNGGALIT